MPYKLGKSSSCPASKPFAVLKEDGKVVPGGCHAKREDALKHQRALTANVSDAAELADAEERAVVVELYQDDRNMLWRDL